jgi:hypothetical protein
MFFLIFLYSNLKKQNIKVFFFYLINLFSFFSNSIKNDGFEVEDIFEKLLKTAKQWLCKIHICFENIIASLGLLLVPNFDAFGVLDDFDDENSSDYNI